MSHLLNILWSLELSFLLLSSGTAGTYGDVGTGCQIILSPPRFLTSQAPLKFIYLHQFSVSIPSPTLGFCTHRKENKNTPDFWRFPTALKSTRKMTNKISTLTFVIKVQIFWKGYRNLKNNLNFFLEFLSNFCGLPRISEF